MYIIYRSPCCSTISLLHASLVDRESGSVYASDHNVMLTTFCRHKMNCFIGLKYTSCRNDEISVLKFKEII